MAKDDVTVVGSDGALARRLRGSWAGIAALPGLALWALTVLSYPPGGGPPSYLPLLLALFWVGPATWLVGVLAGRDKNLGAHGVAVEGDVLRLTNDSGAVRRIWRAEIASATESAEGALLLELRSGQRLSIALGAARTRAVLADLGITPGSRRSVLRWQRRRDALLGGLIGLMLPLLALIPFPNPAVGALTLPLVSGLPWLLALWFGELAATHSLTVGADGIELRSGLRRRIVRFADVAELRSGPTGLDLVRVDGTVEPILTKQDDPGRRAAAARAIDEARSRAGERAKSRRTLDLPSLDQGFARFREAAGQTLTAGGFRVAEVSADDVAAVLDDPLGAPEERIAAAIALAQSGEPDAVQRVRIAAETSVSPKLRIALDAAAEGELEEAMVEEARNEVRRRR